MELFNKFFSDNYIRAVFSAPVSGCAYVRVVMRPVAVKGKPLCQIEKFTKTQVFHENISSGGASAAASGLMEDFKSFNGFTDEKEYFVKITKKGKALSGTKTRKGKVLEPSGHNREKNHILKDGMFVPALHELGIMSLEGFVLKPMYSKFKQVNRFVEIIDDYIKDYPKDEITVVDFGCGKSYLTFVLYHYLTKIRGIKANVVGMDLKSDVIDLCNTTALKYGYDGLKFIYGDIASYSGPKPDMVISLHACDTATDYALFCAVKMKAEMIFSVPCCQHELNLQLETSRLSLFTKYSLTKERLCSILTDNIRGALLEGCGYDVSLMEFIDMEHSPKNILIRAKLSNSAQEKRARALLDARGMLDEFGLKHTFYELLQKEGII